MIENLLLSYKQSIMFGWNGHESAGTEDKTRDTALALMSMTLIALARTYTSCVLLLHKNLSSIFHSFYFFLIDKIILLFFFFFQAEDGIRDLTVTGVQTCALPISGVFIPRP